MVARPLSVFFPELEPRDGPLERVFAGERIERLHFVMQRSSWLTVPVSMTLVPLRQDCGSVEGCTVVVWDLTEQVFSQQTLADSEDLVRRSEALAGIGRFVVDTRDGSTQLSGRRECTPFTGPAPMASMPRCPPISNWCIRSGGPAWPRLSREP